MKESEFVPRLERPRAGNKYYITKKAGGWSSAIKGKPEDAECDVLSNCVGYAYGRFNEIAGCDGCRYLKPVNAERFLDYAGTLETGGADASPRVGAVMVWRGGKTKGGTDGAGHVAIVEQVKSADEVVTSESGWGSKVPFRTKTRRRGDGNWGAGASHTFLGFIYNPAVEPETNTPISEGKKVSVSVLTVKKGTKGEAVRAAQSLLNLRVGAGLAEDGVCGEKTEAAIRKFQASEKLASDGICGKNTWTALLGG